MIRLVPFLVWLFIGGCGSDAVKEASCSESGLATLQKTCVEMGGDFSASTSASSVDECSASGSGGAGGGEVGGSCALTGEGECEVICDLPNSGNEADADTDADADADADADVDDGTDSDGDGWTDYEEEQAHTNPAQPWDHPYEGGWTIDACRDDLVPTGDSMAVGDVVDAIEWGEHQYADGVRLHDFCDQVVILKSSWVDDLEEPGDDEWTIEALNSATALQALYASHRSDGLMVITHLALVDASDVDREELMAWADALGLTYPVVHERHSWGSFEGMGADTDHIVIGRGGEILQTHGDLSTARSVALDALAR